MACGVEDRGQEPSPSAPSTQKSPELQLGITPSGPPSYLSASFFRFQISSQDPFSLSAYPFWTLAPAPRRHGCHTTDFALRFSSRSPLWLSPAPFVSYFPVQGLQPGPSLGPCPAPCPAPARPPAQPPARPPDRPPASICLWFCPLMGTPHPRLFICGEGALSLQPAVLKLGLGALLRY